MAEKAPWGVRWAAWVLADWRSRQAPVETAQDFVPEAASPIATDNLWRAYAAATNGGATTWASIIQVVIFSIAAAGVIASGVILTLTSSAVKDIPGLAFWLCILLSGAWAGVVVLGGTYYLLTFGGMMRIGRHLKFIECRLLEADPTIDPDTLFEHSRHVGRITSIIGYVVAATTTLIASIGPQVFFVGWWFSQAGASRLQVAGWIVIAGEVLWLLGYGVAAYLINRPAACIGDHRCRSCADAG